MSGRRQKMATGEEKRVSQRTASVLLSTDNVNALSSHEAVTELLLLMKENGRGPQAMELSYMTSSIDNMDKQYRELLSTVRNMREQLVEAIEQSYTLTEERPDLSMYQEMQDETERILTQLTASKDKITVWAKTAVEIHEQLGMEGLNAALSTLNVRGMVKTLRKQANNSALNIIDAVLRAEKEGKFQSVLLTAIRPIRTSQKILHKAARTIFGSAEHLAGSTETAQKVHIEQTVQKSRECMKGTPSIRQTLKKNQSEIAANSTPASDKKKDKEVVL